MARCADSVSVRERRRPHGRASGETSGGPGGGARGVVPPLARSAPAATPPAASWLQKKEDGWGAAFASRWLTRSRWKRVGPSSVAVMRSDVLPQRRQGLAETPSNTLESPLALGTRLSESMRSPEARGRPDRPVGRITPDGDAGGAAGVPRSRTHYSLNLEVRSMPIGNRGAWRPRPAGTRRSARLAQKR